jgi:hypothetical protein
VLLVFIFHVSSGRSLAKRNPSLSLPGLGRELGEAALDNYTKMKTVDMAGRWHIW